MKSRRGAEFRTFELRKLERDIRGAGDRSKPYLRRAVRWSADELAEHWRRNARLTARRHGKHYPEAIGFDLFYDGMAAVVGPDASHPKGQGGMAFEYGSRNQPPHLDGNRAMDEIEGRFLLRVRNAMDLDL